MLKNPYKATRFHYDSHDCNSNGKCILQEGWLATIEDFKVSLVYDSLSRPFSAHLPPISKKNSATFR